MIAKLGNCMIDPNADTRQCETVLLNLLSGNEDEQ